MKRIIIFGASSGIGESLAQKYAQEGNKICACARRVKNLEQLQKKFPDNIMVSGVDVSTLWEEEGGNVQETVRSQFNDMVKMLGGVDLVIYCSGVGKQNKVLDTAIECSTINVNIKGFTAVVTATVNYAKGVAHNVQFATIASVASVRGISISASYSATKMYQVRYMESMRQLAHIEKWNMNFTTLLPGFIATDFIKDRKYPLTMSLEHAVKRIKRAIDKKKNSKIIDCKWACVVGLWRLIPNWLWYRLPIQ